MNTDFPFILVTREDLIEYSLHARVIFREPSKKLKKKDVNRYLRMRRADGGRRHSSEINKKKKVN